MVELTRGRPARCVQEDKDGFFAKGQITWVNNLVDVPVGDLEETRLYAMMQHQKGFVYVPASYFEGLTEEEEAEFEKSVEELTNQLETTN